MHVIHLPEGSWGCEAGQNEIWQHVVMVGTLGFGKLSLPWPCDPTSRLVSLSVKWSL